MLFAFQVYCRFCRLLNHSHRGGEDPGDRSYGEFQCALYIHEHSRALGEDGIFPLLPGFRDYVYFPLGGGREGRLRKDINIMIVFLVSGLWHGAGMHYVAWGGINGLYQVIGERLKPIREKTAVLLHVKTDVLSFRLYKVLVTFLLTLFSDIFFRANDMAAAGTIIASIFTTHNPWILFDGSLYKLGLGAAEFRFMLICIGVLIFADIMKRMGISIRKIIGEQGYVFQGSVFCFCSDLPADLRSMGAGI